MFEFIRLEAHMDSKRCHRAYEIEISDPDLFGMFIVSLRHGRAHRPRLIEQRLSAPTLDIARAIAARALKRRASAPRRIGTGYEIVEQRNWNDALH